jgi:C4-dicarboxylate-specific signal transduction histidine kinase
LVVNGIDAIANMPNGVREIACRSWASDGPARPGLPLDRSFEPLFTTKQEGMGKGLCITHAVIESHGGKVSAKNDASGAVFHGSLPLGMMERSTLQ